MDYILPDELRVAAIDPSHRGLGFAVLEGPSQLLDCVRQAEEGDKNAKCVAIVRELIDRYRPHVLVVENATRKSSRRCERVHKLFQTIRETARQKGVKVLEETTERVQRAFVPKKDTVAASTAAQAAHAHHERTIGNAGFRRDGVCHDVLLLSESEAARRREEGCSGGVRVNQITSIRCSQANVSGRFVELPQRSVRN